MICKHIQLPISEYSPIFIQAHMTYSGRLSCVSIYSILRGFSLVLGLWESLQLRCQKDKMFIWALFVVLFSVAKYKHQNQKKQILDDPTHMQRIAEQLGQYQPGQDQLLAQNLPRLSRSQVEKMIQQLKNKVDDVDPQNRHLGRSILFISQFLIIAYLYIVNTFHYSTIKNSPFFCYSGNCNDTLLNVSKAIFWLIFIDNLFLYIFIVLVLMAIPFICSFNLFRRTQKFIRLYLLKRKLHSFTEHNYQGRQDPWVLEEHECRICMSEYAEGERLMQLPCHNVHHFHSSCIREWLKVLKIAQSKISIECPLCRARLLDVSQLELQEIQQI